MALKAVIFDMDGLMLDTERLGREAWDLAGRELELDVPDTFYLKLVGRRMQEVEQIIREELGSTFPAAPYMERADLHYNRLVHEAVPPVKPGIFELLEFLNSRNIPVAVGTSTRYKSALRSLEATGLASFFTRYATGDRVERGKPAPDIFLLAARELGIPPSECLILEDSDYGVRAGHAAGATVYMVPDQSQPGHEIRSLAAGVFASLHEVLDHLRKTSLFVVKTV